LDRPTHWPTRLPTACLGTRFEQSVDPAGGSRQHAGRIHRDRVVSKWGRGQLWDHRLYEIPAHYGSDLQFFDEVPREIARGEFRDFARRRLESEGFEDPFDDS
jgi:hypothetical protein